MAQWLHIPGARAAAAEEGRVSLILDEKSRGDGGPVPLRAVVILREGTEVPTMRPAPAVEAVRDVLALTFHLPSAASRAASFARVADLTVQVEILNLHRRMTIASLGDVVTLVERHLGGAG